MLTFYLYKNNVGRLFENVDMKPKELDEIEQDHLWNVA